MGHPATLRISRLCHFFLDFSAYRNRQETGIPERRHYEVQHTISGNVVRVGTGGAVSSSGTLTISNGTISSNSATSGGGISSREGALTFQNSIVANSTGGDCAGIITSKGYNLSSDATCNFGGPGDMNNTDPMLGPLQNNGGPTPTLALPSGSPAIDAGNPAGCTDGCGHLLNTDQRGALRPDKEDTGGCDIGAYERQSD